MAVVVAGPICWLAYLVIDGANRGEAFQVFQSATRWSDFVFGCRFALGFSSLVAIVVFLVTLLESKSGKAPSNPTRPD